MKNQQPQALHSNNDTYVIIGKVGAPFGIKGWVKVTSYTASADNVLSYNPWFLAENNAWKQVKVESGQPHGKSIIVKLAGCNNPEEARLLTGKEIAVLKSQLPTLKKNEYYWSDLEGLTVIDQTDTVLGKVIYLMATGSNDVLVVKGEHGEIAIPYLTNVIKRVDLDAQVIYVEWDAI